MSNQKITDLTAGNRPLRSDLWEMSQNPGSTPISRKITTSQIILPYTDIPPDTANALDDEFDGNSLSGQWTWVTQGSATVAFGGSLAQFLVDTTGAVNHRYIVQATPMGNWIATAKISLGAQPASANATSQGTGWGGLLSAGLTIRDSATGKVSNLYLIYDSYWRGYCQQFTNNTFNTTTAYFDKLREQQWYWVRIQNDGTSYIFSISYDGIFFYPFRTETIGSWITANQIGLMMDARTGIKFWFTCDYFRVQ